MMKKIISFLCACIVLSCFAVPAYAASGSASVPPAAVEAETEGPQPRINRKGQVCIGVNVDYSTLAEDFNLLTETVTVDIYEHDPTIKSMVIRLYVDDVEKEKVRLI